MATKREKGSAVALEIGSTSSEVMTCFIAILLRKGDNKVVEGLAIRTVPSHVAPAPSMIDPSLQPFSSDS